MVQKGTTDMALISIPVVVLAGMVMTLVIMCATAATDPLPPDTEPQTKP